MASERPRDYADLRDAAVRMLKASALGKAAKDEDISRFNQRQVQKSKVWRQTNWHVRFSLEKYSSVGKDCS
jgi:hypothetical protein